MYFYGFTHVHLYSWTIGNLAVLLVYFCFVFLFFYIDKAILYSNSLYFYSTFL